MGWSETQCTRYVVAASLFDWLGATSRVTSSASLRPPASRLAQAAAKPAVPAPTSILLVTFAREQHLAGEHERRSGSARHQRPRCRWRHAASACESCRSIVSSSNPHRIVGGEPY